MFLRLWDKAMYKELFALSLALLSTGCHYPKPSGTWSGWASSKVLRDDQEREHVVLAIDVREGTAVPDPYKSLISMPELAVILTPDGKAIPYDTVEVPKKLEVTGRMSVAREAVTAPDGQARTTYRPWVIRLRSPLRAAASEK